MPAKTHLVAQNDLKLTKLLNQSTAAVTAALQVGNHFHQSIDRLGQAFWQYAVLRVDVLVGNPAMRDPDIVLGMVVVHAIAVFVAHQRIGVRQQ